MTAGVAGFWPEPHDTCNKGFLLPNATPIRPRERQSTWHRKLAKSAASSGSGRPQCDEGGAPATRGFIALGKAYDIARTLQMHMDRAAQGAGAFPVYDPYPVNSALTAGGKIIVQ